MISIRLIDAYAGKDVISYDPDRCTLVEPKGVTYLSKGNNQETFERGCILGATARAGISEVILYENDPANRAPFPWWIFD